MTTEETNKIIEKVLKDFYHLRGEIDKEAFPKERKIIEIAISLAREDERKSKEEEIKDLKQQLSQKEKDILEITKEMGQGCNHFNAVNNALMPIKEVRRWKLLIEEAIKSSIHTQETKEEGKGK